MRKTAQKLFCSKSKDCLNATFVQIISLVRTHTNIKLILWLVDLEIESFHKWLNVFRTLRSFNFPVPPSKVLKGYPPMTLMSPISVNTSFIKPSFFRSLHLTNNFSLYPVIRMFYKKRWDTQAERYSLERCFSNKIYLLTCEPLLHVQIVLLGQGSLAPHLHSLVNVNKPKNYHI